MFGDPRAGDCSRWGWRYQGYHASLHFNVVCHEGKPVIVSVPTFLGAQPLLLDEEADGVNRIETAAWNFFDALTSQERKAMLQGGNAFNQLQHGTTSKAGAVAGSAGLRYDSLSSKTQQDLLLDILERFAEIMTTEIAVGRIAVLKAAGLGGVTIAWWGGTKRQSNKYYRIQGPTFVVESAMVDGGSNHNHICWRDFDADFAANADYFAEHVRADMLAEGIELPTENRTSPTTTTTPSTTITTSYTTTPTTSPMPTCTCPAQSPKRGHRRLGGGLEPGTNVATTPRAPNTTVSNVATTPPNTTVSNVTTI